VEVFQVNATIKKRLRNCKRRIRRRLRPRQWPEQRRRLFRDRNIHYDLGDKARGLHAAGLGACHLLVQRLGLADAIDRALHLLKRHLPYFDLDIAQTGCRSSRSWQAKGFGANSLARPNGSLSWSLLQRPVDCQGPGTALASSWRNGFCIRPTSSA
jgi:hypothetical protein